MSSNTHNLYILGIDTSCDETSAAVLKSGRIVLSNIVSSQVEIHQTHGGVVPEIASRAHIENLALVIDRALKSAGLSFQALSGIAVTTSPGLIGCLLVGLSYAKALSYTLGIPLTAVHHLKAHLFSPFLKNTPVYPFLGLVVSGGHTALYYVSDFDEIQCLGQTVDDAAGEAFDKVSKLLGLGYPGGPVIDRLSREGNPDAYSFTKARVKRGPYYFSFSGLKTAVRLLVDRPPAGHHLPIPDLCASFQKSVIDSLVEKIKKALLEHPARGLAVSGGVAVNSLLRKEIKRVSEECDIPAYIPTPLLCTDNGAMVAYVGALQLERGRSAKLDQNAYPSAPLW